MADIPLEWPALGEGGGNGNGIMELARYMDSSPGVELLLRGEALARRVVGPEVHVQVLGDVEVRSALVVIGILN